MTGHRPKAAVVVPAYNGVDTIVEALKSLERSAMRTSEPVVGVVVDDASGDTTIEAVSDFCNRSLVEIRLIRHRSNLGTGAARNTGIAAVEADCYLFLDQDDIFLPDHVPTCLAALGQDPHVDYVATMAVLDPPVHPDWDARIANSLVLTLCVRRHAHRLIGGFMNDPATNKVRCEDVLYRRLLARFTRGRTVDRRTVEFRCQPGNSFERQWERKFSRPAADAEVTMPADRLAAMPEVQRALLCRTDEIAARVARLGGARRPV